MNKDTRIKWNVGMELVPETFIHLENQLAEYRQMLRKVQASKQFGLIPDMPFHVSVSVDGNTLVLHGVECHALLQQGGLVDVVSDAEVSLDIPTGADDYYLAVWCSDNEREYELDDVPFVSNECTYGLLPLEALPGKMPIAKVVREEDQWKVQDDYIVPLVSMESSTVMTEMAKAMTQLARQLTTHEKFAHIRNHDLMLLLIDEMDCVNGSQCPKDFAVLCRRLARLLAYTIFDAPVVFAEYNPYDIQLFLSNICAFLIKAHEVLPTVEIVEYQPVAKEPEPEPEVPQVEEEEDFPIL